MGKIYLRKKVNAWIIERKDNKNKTEYLMKLPKLMDIIKWKRPDLYYKIASQSTKKKPKKIKQKFPQELLSERLKAIDDYELKEQQEAIDQLLYDITK